MAISPLYIPLFNIEEVILDKDTGLPLSGGVVKFYRDSQRVTPKPVYTITGTSPNYTFTSVGTQLTLGIAGDFVDGNGNPFVPYAYPYDENGDIDLYYVTVVSSGNVAQFVRQAVPYVVSSEINPGDIVNDGNQISNPQFVEISFPQSGSTTLSITGSNTVTPIAPDWDIISSGTGNIVIERLEPTASNVPTNPPYALRIEADAAFGAAVTLRQRLYNSPSIFRGGFASATFTAAVISGGNSAISLTYAPSVGTSTQIIPNTSITTDGAYHTIQGNSEITVQNNDPASTGYIDILITIPTGRNIAITSIQVIGLEFSADIIFDEQSSARQKDHLFHYYEDAVVRQPKSNLLTGWNFGLNPWQFRSSTTSNLANNAYTADQTIIVQQAYVDSATANNVAIGSASFTENYAFEIKAVTATNKFAMIQYIEPYTIAPYWGQTLSLRIRANFTTTQVSPVIPRFKVRLMYKAGLPGTISQTVPVSAWANTDDAIPTVSGDSWTYINAISDPTYTLTGTMTDFNFDGFTLPASTNANMTLAVVFIMMNNLIETGTADLIHIERVSLVNNHFAIDASPETWDESLRKCQYYFEHSYDVSQPAIGTGVVSEVGTRFTKNDYIENGGAVSIKRRPFGSDFMQVKNKVPTMRFYSPDSTTADRVRIILRDANGNATLSSTNTAVSTGYSALSASTTNFYYLPTVSAEVAAHAGVNAQQYYVQTEFHYEADSRLGV